LDRLAGKPTPESRKANLKLITWLAVLLDSKFQLGPIKLGMSPILKMVPIPFAAPLFTLGVSTYIVYLSLKFDVSLPTLLKMYALPIVSFIVSMVPIFGGPMSALLDAGLKPTIRQVNALKDVLSQEDDVAVVQRELANAGH
jgi:hypothetical protein